MRAAACSRGVGEMHCARMAVCVRVRVYACAHSGAVCRLIAQWQQARPTLVLRAVRCMRLLPALLLAWAPAATAEVVTEVQSIRALLQ